MYVIWHGPPNLDSLISTVFPEAADASRVDDVQGQDESDRAPDAAAGAELVLEVVDVQVPHPVQAHRRHIPHTVPDGVRHVQHVLLVHVPVPRGRGRGQVIPSSARVLRCHSVP